MKLKLNETVREIKRTVHELAEDMKHHTENYQMGLISLEKFVEGCKDRANLADQTIKDYLKEGGWSYKEVDAFIQGELYNSLNS